MCSTVVAAGWVLRAGLVSLLDLLRFAVEESRSDEVFAVLGFLLSALGVCAWTGGSEAAEQPLPVIGAIRWDGWFQDNPWERNLASEQWRYRLPFLCHNRG